MGITPLAWTGLVLARIRGLWNEHAPPWGGSSGLLLPGTEGLSLYRMRVFRELNVYCVQTKKSGSYPGRDTPAPGFTDLSAD